jgi:hypothetical protein
VPAVGEAALVMELAKGGGLFERLVDEGTRAAHLPSALNPQP